MAKIRSTDKPEAQAVPQRRKLTEEQKARARERELQRKAAMTPEEREALKEKQRAYMNTRNAAMTPEERAAFNERQREATRAHRERRTAEQIQADRDSARERTRQRRATLPPEQIKAEQRRYTERRKEWEKIDTERRAARLATAQRFYAALRQTALIRYSSDPAHCVCCNEQHVEFLTIDHIDGGGTQHRKALNASSIYTWLKRNGYPDGYRTLCFNCNWAVQFGPCPHEREKVVPFERPQGGCS